ncbi:hypothetical protein BDW22DRAFT_1180488 [Trametopsis cervina]|nr:hypothetical protein BDW22DRAFT_1180488 [Trametopsis cervina]
MHTIYLCLSDRRGATSTSSAPGRRAGAWAIVTTARENNNLRRQLSRPQGSRPRAALILTLWSHFLSRHQLTLLMPADERARTVAIVANLAQPAGGVFHTERTHSRQWLQNKVQDNGGVVTRNYAPRSCCFPHTLLPALTSLLRLSPQPQTNRRYQSPPALSPQCVLSICLSLSPDACSLIGACRQRAFRCALSAARISYVLQILPDAMRAFDGRRALEATFGVHLHLHPHSACSPRTVPHLINALNTIRASFTSIVRARPHTHNFFFALLLFFVLCSFLDFSYFLLENPPLHGRSTPSFLSQSRRDVRADRPAT